jgi:hypothetical protein
MHLHEGEVMKHPHGTFAAPVILIALICAWSLPLASAQFSTKAYCLPSGATDIKSLVLANDPKFLVSISEGGAVPGDAKATCDNRAVPGSVGLVLQHYFAKEVFEQMAGVLRPITLTQSIHDEAGAATVVPDTVGGAEAVYFLIKSVCGPSDMGGPPPVNPTSSRIVYQARLFRDTTYATFEVRMDAVGPDIPRKYVQEMMQKIPACAAAVK